MRIHFHLGVHKTATTYIQSRMRENIDGLRDNNIAFIDLWSKSPDARMFRNAVRASVWAREPDGSSVQLVIDALRKMLDTGCEQMGSDKNLLVVLSFENLLGSYDLSGRERVYTNAGVAAEILKSAFGDSDLRVFLSYRSLDEYLESGYLQLVSTQRETRNFEKYLSEVRAKDISWIPLVEDVFRYFGNERTTLWAYEDFKAIEHIVWQRLLDVPEPDRILLNKARSKNQRFSSRACELMLMINGCAMATAEIRKFGRFVKKEFSVSNGYSVPDLLSHDLRNHLREKYREELGYIESVSSNHIGSATL